MVYEQSCYPELNFVFSCLRGQIRDADLVEHVTSLNAKAAGMTAALELADCRQVEDVEQLTVRGAIEAAKLEAGQPRAEGGRLAIVAGSQVVFGFARVYATFAEDIRASVGVFSDMEEALDWLGSGPWRETARALIE